MQRKINRTHLQIEKFIDLLEPFFMVKGSLAENVQKY